MLLINKINVALCLASSLCLNACSNVKDASNGNFTKVLNDSFNELVACVNTPGDYPKTFTKFDYTAFKVENALAQKNLLTIQDTEVVVNTYTGAKSPAKIFSLSKEGEKYFNKDTGSLCYSKGIAIDEIVSFTEPAERNGVKITNVTYKAKRQNVAEWVRDPIISKYLTLQNMNPVMKGLININEKDLTDVEIGNIDKADGRVQMVLTNNGWKLDYSTLQ